ncbi:MAG TPA: thiaminase II [Candidatus Binatia bacterium]|nr:thiaminase II [Candidatus Binatia bacterium]
MASLTTALWERIEPIYARILAHPFVTGLTEGSLDRSAFRFYIVQDAHYLRDYARALGLLAARAPEEDQILLFCRHAVGAIEVERQLHEGFFQEFGLSAADVDRTPVAPTNLAYTSYLLRVAHGGSWPEALGAVLPCYWIYWEVGKALLEKGSPDPLYRRWIEAYGGEDFGEVVDAVLGVTDRVGERIGEAERRRLSDHFETTSRYEWMFWDMGYRQEAWPVP